MKKASAAKSKRVKTEGAHDILRQMRRNPLDAIFRPRSVPQRVLGGHVATGHRWRDRR